jgi:hypothetical protein
MYEKCSQLKKKSHNHLKSPGTRVVYNIPTNFTRYFLYVEFSDFYVNQSLGGQTTYTYLCPC